MISIKKTYFIAYFTLLITIVVDSVLSGTLESCCEEISKNFPYDSALLNFKHGFHKQNIFKLFGLDFSIGYFNELLKNVGINWKDILNTNSWCDIYSLKKDLPKCKAEIPIKLELNNHGSGEDNFKNIYLSKDDSMIQKENLYSPELHEIESSTDCGKGKAKLKMFLNRIYQYPFDYYTYLSEFVETATTHNMLTVEKYCLETTTNKRTSSNTHDEAETDNKRTKMENSTSLPSSIT